MPTYEYRCDACGHEFEQFQSITAKSLRKCPECKKAKLKRLIGIGAGVIFKGSGFYETDYRSDSYKKSAKAEADASKGKKEGKSKSIGSSKSEGSSGKSADTASKSSSSTVSSGSKSKPGGKTSSADK